MAGASPPGPMNPLKKPTETKDGTSPLSPGQSQGVTGANPGSVSPAAATTAAAGMGLTVKIEAPADVPKASDGNPIFSITAEPKMPTIKAMASISGVTTGADPTANTEFEWTASVSYDSRNSPHGVATLKRSWGLPVGASRKIAEITTKGKVTGGAISVNFDKIRGGSLTIKVTASIGGQTVTGETKGWRIQGTNPPIAAVNQRLPDEAMRKLTCLESQKQQFVAAPNDGGALYPYWSGDGLLGVGIGQLTNPQPTDDQIWDWTQNVSAAVILYNQKKAQAKGYPKVVATSPKFIQLVKEYTDNLNKAPEAAAAAAPPNPVQVKVPEFTEEQLQDDTIRGFNGWPGDDGLTSGSTGGIHEFRIKRDPDTNALVVEGDPTTGTVNAVWERVPISERPRKDKDDRTPEYVDLVKSYNPATCSRSK